MFLLCTQIVPSVEIPKYFFPDFLNFTIEMNVSLSHGLFDRIEGVSRNFFEKGRGREKDEDMRGREKLFIVPTLYVGDRMSE